MLLRPFLNDAGSCASYLFGCTSHNRLAVVDPHVDLVGYLAAAERAGSPIVAVMETHVQADHLSGLPALVGRTAATAYLPARPASSSARGGRERPAHQLGNAIVTALATPSHAPPPGSFVVADRRRGSEEPWLVFTGDSLLIGDVGRPDLHEGSSRARTGRASARRSSCCSISRSRARIPEPPRRIRLRPRVSRQPFSSIGYERAHNPMLNTATPTRSRTRSSPCPPPPTDRAAIVAANRRGEVLVAA